MVDVKICGIKDQDILRAAVRAGADYVGFMLVPQSPRAVTLAQTDGLLAQAGLAAGVAVVADPDDALVDAIKFTGFPIIQLHGSESPERVRLIKEGTGAEIWKAVSVRERADLAACAAYTSADKLLIDAKPQDGETMGGGHGVPFDWSILNGWKAPKPWFLAGGLTVDNVADAIAATGATAVDVSSGVERERGVKDAALIEQFITEAKAA